MNLFRDARGRASGAAGGAYNRSRRFFIDTENTKLVLAFVILGVTLSLAIPTVFPELKRSGPDCVSLMSPPGGNQRSMLAENGDTRQDLTLIVDIDANQANGKEDPLIRVGEPLIIDVVFQNDDIGAITFFITDDAIAIGPPAGPESVGGVYLQITHAATNQPYSDPSRQGIAPNTTTSFNYEDLHVLQSRRRCAVRVIIEPERLAAMNMGVGEYETRAYYYNPSRGPLPTPRPQETPTATPMFADQGVWSRSAAIASRVVRFEIGSP